MIDNKNTNEPVEEKDLSESDLTPIGEEIEKLIKKLLKK